jgi:purine-binding chemotaxis protein CheW
MTEEAAASETDSRPGPDGVDRTAMEVERRGLLALRLGDARFGLWVDEVLEVVRTPPISRLPLPQPELAGVTSVRGEVVPVLDLGLRLLGTAARRPGRMVLVRHEPTQAMVGLLVDDVETLVTPMADEIRPPPKAAEAALPPELVTGVLAHDDGVVTILHLGRAAAPPEADSSED